MKLNKKGYMLVEIIVSFVLAFSIAIYLLNLTIKFKDTNSDTYYSATYLKDKNLITRNIMDSLDWYFQNYNVVDIEFVDTDTDTVIDTILFAFTSIENARALDVNVKIKVDKANNTITYGMIDSYTGDFVIEYDDSYYTKKLGKSLTIGTIEDCSELENRYFCAKIPISSIYDDENYDIKLFSTFNVLNNTQE